MKKLLHIALTCLLLTLVLNSSNAQTKLIHYWHFNKNTTASVHLNNFKADYSILDTNKAMIVHQFIAGTSSGYLGYVDNYLPTALALDTPNINMNAKFSTPAGVAIRVRNPSDSAELRFYIPSTGYQNLLLKYMSESSSATSGQKVLSFDYSVDSGSTWKTTGLTKTTDTTDPATFKLVSVPFSDALDTMIRNNRKLVFRIKFIGQNTTTSGNSRFDNVTIEGDTLTVVPPSTAVGNISLSNATCAVYPNPASTNITIATSVNSTKNIAIVNATGQKLYAAKREEKDINIDISTWATGVYYILVNDSNGGNAQMKFIKQ